MFIMNCRYQAEAPITEVTEHATLLSSFEVPELYALEYDIFINSSDIHCGQQVCLQEQCASNWFRLPVFQYHLDYDGHNY